MSYRIDFTGKRFGRWTVLKRSTNNGSHQRYECVCDCGSKSIVYMQNLRRGLSLSCGCLAIERCKKRCITHGKTGTRAHRIWRAMKDRCYYENNIGFHLYGGRGIKVCGRWKNSFANFLEDMGDPPTNGHSIERIDTNGDYTPDNCKWATSSEQANNTRANHLLEIDGKTMTMAEAAREFGITYAALSSRIYRGWPIRQALGLEEHK